MRRVPMSTISFFSLTHTAALDERTTAGSLISVCVAIAISLLAEAITLISATTTANYSRLLRPNWSARGAETYVVVR